VLKEVMRMKKALAAMGTLVLLGALGTGCVSASRVKEQTTRAEAAATRAEDASRRAEAGVARAEASCDRCAAMGEKAR
jgi:hypothetical protein